MDPRRWDLHQLLAAYETAVRQSAKDEATWNRFRNELYAEPAEVRRERMATPAKARSAPRVGMTLASVEALIAGAAARDAQYGAAQ